MKLKRNKMMRVKLEDRKKKKYKRRVRSNLRVLPLSLANQSIWDNTGSILGAKACSWSINYSTVEAEIRILWAVCVINFYSTAWSRKVNKLHINHQYLISLWVFGGCLVRFRRQFERFLLIFQKPLGRAIKASEL